MHAQSDYSAALGVGVNVPRSDLGSVARKQLLDRSTTILSTVAKVYHGRVLDASGGNLSILFRTCNDAMQAACEMRRRIATLAPQGTKPITVTIGASTRLGTAMALMLNAAPGEIAADPDFSAALEAPTVIDEAIPPPPVAAPPKARPQGDIAGAEKPSSSPERNRRASDRPPISASKSPATEKNPPPPVSVPAPGRTPAKAVKSAPPAADAAKTAPVTHLALAFKGKTIIIDERMVPFTLGRGDDCRLQILEMHVSRVHASIVYQEGRFLLVDSSSNGTFVRQAGAAEIKVWRSAHVLDGSGDLSLGIGGKSGDSSKIRYALS